MVNLFILQSSYVFVDIQIVEFFQDVVGQYLLRPCIPWGFWRAQHRHALSASPVTWTRARTAAPARMYLKKSVANLWKRPLEFCFSVESLKLT